MALLTIASYLILGRAALISTVLALELSRHVGDPYGHGLRIPAPQYQAHHWYAIRLYVTVLLCSAAVLA
jgi:hypothetical protein